MPIKRGYHEHGDACATAHAFELLGDRWTYPVLRELMLGPKRFVELSDGVRGITPAVLTARLREMETHGLITRVTLPGRVAAYDATPWARELRPVFEHLGRWAQASSVRQNEGGLTPDATVQSMLTMAPVRSLSRPTTLELRLYDGRLDDPDTYEYRLTWADRLEIERGAAPGADAIVTADSSTWTSILYDGTPLAEAEVTGDERAVRRVVEAFAT